MLRYFMITLYTNMYVTFDVNPGTAGVQDCILLEVTTVSESSCASHIRDLTLQKFR
jgi:hypothetical protein